MNLSFIKKIYDLSVDSYNMDEIPVGAIVVKNNNIIGVSNYIFTGEFLYEFNS